MRWFEGFEANIVSINGKNIIFNKHIITIRATENMIFVLLDIMQSKSKNYYFILDMEERFKIAKNTPDKLQEIYADINDSFHCYDYDGNLLWTLNMPNKFKDIKVFFPDTIVGIYYDKENVKLYIFDFYERRYEININNGKVLSVSAPRNTSKVYIADGH